MKAILVEEFKKRPQVKEVPEPKIRGPFGALVRMHASGVCHTDLHAADGDWPVKPTLPFIPGHEGVGVVEEVGALVTNVSPGDRVGIPWLHSACGECSYCLTGWETLCESQENTGYSVNGGFAELALADARYLGKIPGGLQFTDVAPHFCAGVTTYKAVKVSGSAWNPPWSNYKGQCSSTALFEMNNGARVLYNASWCAKGGFCDWNANWQIECEKGTVTYRNGEIRVYHVPKLYKLEKTEILTHTAPPLTAQNYVLDEFIRCVKTRKQPNTVAKDNIRSVGMVFATVNAIETGRKVDVLDRETLALLKRK